MLRAFILTSRKLLIPRPLPVHTLSAAAASSSTTIYDVRRNSRVVEPHRNILPITNHGHPLLGRNSFLLTDIRYASKKPDFKFPDPSVIVCNMINMLKCVDLKDLKDTPAPGFWLSVVFGSAQMVIPLLELISGYSNTMTIFQLHLAAITVTGLAGVKWGRASPNKPLKPDWDTLISCITPITITLIGLLLPYPLAFLTVAGAMVSTLYLDLKDCFLPAWGNAVRLLLTVTTVAGLLMALTAYLLFHNRENEKKKEEKKEKKKGAAEEDEENGEEGKDKKDKNGKNK